LISRHRRSRRTRRIEHRRATVAKRTVLAGTGISLGASLFGAASAQAADFTVTNLNDGGAGSLRQAITDANAAPGSDRILFQSKLTGQITLGSELPGIQDGVEIAGPGADKLAISGNNSFRIFNVNPTFAMNMPPVTISGLKLTAGSVTSADGAAIGSKYTDLTVSNSVISQNNATGLGGGIASVGGNVTIRSSTISGNSASSGGGIFDESGSAATGLTVENSTITGNSTTNEGGGLFFSSSSPSAPFTVRSSTISDNTAVGTTYGGGGFYIRGGGTGTVTNTIVAGNTANAGPDISTGPSTSVSAAFSLIENTSGAAITGSPDIFGKRPLLAPLADNGGPTPTQALLNGSPALDAGSSAGLATDQRGAPRPFDLKGINGLPGGNGADIGAYERNLCGKVIVNRVGTPGNDVLVGSPGADGILGLAGNDKLKGLAGNDALCGGPGKDKLKGGAGNDLLVGGAGKDVLIGGKGKDKLKGGKGKDKEKQ
jgi:Ca2+-binding RTX toxin-like protein